MTTSITTLAEFYTALKNFDWYYNYSDDAYFWRLGNERDQQFKTLVKNGPMWNAMYEDWKRYMFRGVHKTQGDVILPLLSNYTNDEP